MARFDPAVHGLALDFDGVICDSIAECLLVGYNAFRAFTCSGPAVSRYEEIPAAQRAAARSLRPYIRSGEDYVYIYHAFSENAEITDQAAFDSFCVLHAGLRDSYLDAFYSQRERMAVQFPSHWINLNPLYPGMRNFLRRYKKPERLFIVSTKRAAYILQLLRGHGIPFSPDHVLGTHSSGPKPAVLRALIQKQKPGARLLFFVDDQVDTLLKINSPDICCILARWGYTGPDQVASARQADLTVMDLPQFYKTFRAGGASA